MFNCVETLETLKIMKMYRYQARDSNDKVRESLDAGAAAFFMKWIKYNMDNMPIFDTVRKRREPIATANHNTADNRVNVIVS